MISFISTVPAVTLVVVAYTMRTFINDFHKKGVQFSARSLVLRSCGYAAMTLAPVIALIAYLFLEYDLYETLNPDVRVLDLYVALAFFWAFLANCCLALLLLRANDRLNDQHS